MQRLKEILAHVLFKVLTEFDKLDVKIYAFHKRDTVDALHRVRCTLQEREIEFRYLNRHDFKIKSNIVSVIFCKELPEIGFDAKKQRTDVIIIDSVFYFSNCFDKNTGHCFRKAGIPVFAPLLRHEYNFVVDSDSSDVRENYDDWYYFDDVSRFYDAISDSCIRLEKNSLKPKQKTALEEDQEEY